MEEYYRGDVATKLLHEYYTNGIMEIIVTELQHECHRTVDTLMEEFIEKGKLLDKGSYQDFTNIWIFKKLAEQELRIRELENK